MSDSTTYARIRSQRASGTGVEHWKMQRLTAISNLLLVVWFMFAAISMAGADYVAWRLFFSNPINAALMIALVVSTFYHARLGVQVVIEDYIHAEGVKAASLVALTLAIGLMALVGIVSILMIAIGV